MENLQLLEYIGKTKTQNLTDEIQKEYRELVNKKYPNSHNIITNSLIQVTDLDDTEIKSIGMSCVNDLFLNNLLVMLSFIWSGTGSFTDKLQAGAGFPFTNITNSTSVKFNNPDLGGILGSRVQLGSGSTPPLMDNTSVETPLTSGSPEQDRAICGDSSYSVGLSKITIPTVISPTNGSGTIRESVLFGHWT